MKQFRIRLKPRYAAELLFIFEHTKLIHTELQIYFYFT